MSVLPPRPPRIEAVMAPLDLRLWEALGGCVREPAYDVGQIAEAVVKARRELSFGRPLHLPTERKLYDDLLLNPGPEALASIYALGGRPAIHALASHRAETIHLLGCKLCPGPDVDEPKLRCGHPLPCPRHP